MHWSHLSMLFGTGRNWPLSVCSPSGCLHTYTLHHRRRICTLRIALKCRERCATPRKDCISRGRTGIEAEDLIPRVTCSPTQTVTRYSIVTDKIQCCHLFLFELNDFKGSIFPLVRPPNRALRPVRFFLSFPLSSFLKLTNPTSSVLRAFLPVAGIK